MTAAWMADRGRRTWKGPRRLSPRDGGQPSEAVVLLVRAARAAQSAGALDEALRLFTRVHLTDDPSIKDAAETGVRKFTLAAAAR